MKVLVIPEDRTLDEDILLPVVRHIFRDLGRTATVSILADPHLRGVSQALDKDIFSEIIELYPMVDLFLLILDRDCDEGRHYKVESRVIQARESGRTMVGCLAIEEVEVWALALHRRELSVPWNEVRGHCHPKEAYFEPFVRQKNWLETKGRGRSAAMRALSGNWRSLKAVCDEIGNLQDRLATWLASQ
jgi:hypothetical protein